MTLSRPAAVVAIIAAGLLAAAEFTTLYEVVVGSLETVRREVTGAAGHGYALLVLALATVPLTLLALRGGRGPAAGLTGLGAAALGIVLAIDLPATRAWAPAESLTYEDARTQAAGGLYLELAGAILLLLAGCALLLAARARRVRPAPAPAAPATSQRR